MRIPLVYLKDKQFFRREGGSFRLMGKPLAAARELKSKGCRLIHIIDQDALSGLTKNLDVYDALTYVINVQVECSAQEPVVRKLLSLKCRVVLAPSQSAPRFRESRLLVAKIPKGYKGLAQGFHDVLIEDATDKSIKRFLEAGKRVMIYEKDEEKVKGAWGVLTSSF